MRTAEARKLLLRFSQARPTDKCTPLTDDELEKLKALLQGTQPDAAGDGGQPAAGPQCITDLMCCVSAVQSLRVDGCWECEPFLAPVLYHLGYSQSSDTALIQSQAAYDAIQLLQQDGWSNLAYVESILAQDARVRLEL